MHVLYAVRTRDASDRSRGEALCAPCRPRARAHRAPATGQLSQRAILGIRRDCQPATAPAAAGVARGAGRRHHGSRQGEAFFPRRFSPGAHREISGHMQRYRRGLMGPAAASEAWTMDHAAGAISVDLSRG